MVMAKQSKTYLVNIVLPKSGMTETSKNYRGTLATCGYNRYQQMGSVGGSIAGGSLVWNNGKLTRV